MELYIGGFAQGKTEYVKQRFPEGKWISEIDFENADLDTGERLIINHFHLIVKKLLLQGDSTSQILERCKELIRVNPDMIMICDEIGNGIVPMEKEERIYREETGRILIELAKQADRVERIICGMVQVIKSK